MSMTPRYVHPLPFSGFSEKTLRELLGHMKVNPPSSDASVLELVERTVCP